VFIGSGSRKKSMKKSSGFIMALVLAAGFSACNTGGGPGASLPPARGTVRVSLSLAGLEIPNDYFTRYVLSFTPDSGTAPDPVAVTGGADGEVALPAGTYAISAAAIKDTTEIAIGRVEGIVVTEGDSVEAAIVLGPKTGSGGGTFSYSIDLTGVTGLDGGKGSLFITPMQGGALTVIDLPQGRKTESDSSALPAGSYSVDVSLTKGTKGGGFSGEALHIYAGLGSALSPRTFTDDDDFFALTVVSASLDLGGLFAAPAVNDPPGTGFNAGQYVGAILWSPAITTGGRFAANETYTAYVTLTPAVGYTFAGAALAGLVYDGAGNVGTGVLQDNGTVTVDIVFNPTGALGSLALGASFYHEEMAVSGYADSLVIPRNGSVTFSVSGYDGVKWHLGLGALTRGLSDGGASITLRGAELSPGRHRLTVAGTRHGKPYSRLLEFTVTDEDELVAPADLAAYLANLSGGETPDKPVTVALAPFDVAGNLWGATVRTALSGLSKYIVLDLSACFAANDTISGAFGAIRNNEFNFFKSNNAANQHITGVILPDSLTVIGYCTFYHLFYLKSVVIPAGLTEIGLFAFGGCKALASIDIPAGVTVIGDRAFSSCSSLTTVIFEGNNTTIYNAASFPNDLKTYYDQQAVKAGTYILDNGSWTKTD
jgi:hypothetical protein